MKLFSTAILIIFMLFVQKVDLTKTQSGLFKELSQKSIRHKKSKRNSKLLATQPKERKLESKSPRSLGESLNSIGGILDMLIVVVCVMWLVSALTRQNNSPSSSSPPKNLKIRTRRTRSISQSKEISNQEVLNLPKNKNFPSFVKRLKNDIVRILDKHYLENDFLTPSVEDAISTLRPYLTKKFYFQPAGFLKLKKEAENLFALAEKNPKILPSF